MGKSELLIVILTLFGQSLCQVTDQTRQPEARGPQVVEAVVSYISESCIFPSDKLYLRRLAYVESQDGMNASTYRPGYYGGIWQVDRDKFMLTQTSSALNTYRDEIRQKLYIDWSRVSWSDLTKPLYSGLAAALYTYLVAGQNGVPRGVEYQSTFWKNTTRPNLDANIFYKLANQLTRGCSRNDNLDLVFVLDSSASLSSADFDSTKYFVSSVLDQFNVGKVRVSVVVYSTSVSAAFYLNTYNSKAEVQKAVDGIQRNAGSTRTDLALNFAVDNVFTIAHGSRPGAAKVLILLTDGKSENRVATMAAAARAKTRGINVFTIGVTSAIDLRELDRIASLPTCTHVQTLAAFADLDSLIAEIQQVSCTAPSILIPGNYQFSCGNDYNVQLLPNLVNGTTVTISVTAGSVSVFGAMNFQNPSVVQYEFTKTATPGNPVQIFIKDPRVASLALVTSGGAGCNNNFAVMVEEGDRIRPQYQVICIEQGNLINVCNASNIVQSPYMIVSPPYGPNYNGICLPGAPRFFPDLLMNNRFIYCDGNGNPVIVLCPLSEIFEPILFQCVPGSPMTYTQSTARPTTPSTRMTTMRRTTQRVTFPVTTPRIITQTPLPTNVISFMPCTPENLKAGIFYFPYPNDEKRYIECYNIPFYGVVKVCAENHYWSQAQLTCLYKDPVIDPTVNSYILGLAKPCGSVPDQYFYPHPDSTKVHMYIHCDQYGDAFLKVCPNNFIWFQAIMQCVPRGIIIGGSTPLPPLTAQPGKK